MPTVSRITIFPLKSFDGVQRQDVMVLPSGALKHDRQFALVDSTRRFINAKRTPMVHGVRLVIDPERREFSVARRDGGPETRGHLDKDAETLSDWLSDFFSMAVSIIENDETGFPDDLDAPGPTIVSTSTLRTVAEWFPGLTEDNMRLRFRANIEIDGVEPFWEDRLIRADKNPQPFRIGTLLFGGINPCQRCAVPTRDPLTGQLVPAAFSQQFQKRREETLPSWAPRVRFNHFYRLTTNTRRWDQASGSIRVGDSVELIDG